MAVLVQLAQVHRHAGIEDRIELVALGTAKVAQGQILYLLLGIDLSSVQVGLQVVQLVGVGLIGQDRRPVEVRERFADGVSVVQKVQHEHIVLLGVRPVEPRQGLHRLDAGQRLVHVHGVQQRLVVAGLELVRAHQEAVGVLLEAVGDLGRRQAVQRRLAELHAAVLVLPGEGDQRLVAARTLLSVVADGLMIMDRQSIRASWRTTALDDGHRRFSMVPTRIRNVFGPALCGVRAPDRSSVSHNYVVRVRSESTRRATDFFRCPISRSTMPRSD